MAQPFKDIARGNQQGTAGLLHLGANVFDLINRGGDYLAEKTGIPGKIPGVNFGPGDIAAALRAKESEETPPQATAPTSVMGKVNQGIGELPATLASFLPAARVLGPVAGMGALGGLQEADKGPGAAVQGAVKGALTGGVLKAAEPLVPALRVPAMAAAGAVDTAAQGGDAGDIAAGGILLSASSIGEWRRRILSEIGGGLRNLTRFLLSIYIVSRQFVGRPRALTHQRSDFFSAERHGQAWPR